MSSPWGLPQSLLFGRMSRGDLDGFSWLCHQPPIFLQVHPLTCSALSPRSPGLIPACPSPSPLPVGFSQWEALVGDRRAGEARVQFSSVQLLSRVRPFATPWTAAHQDSLSITNSQSLLTSIESVMPSNHLILCHPVLLPPSIFPSIRVFSIESVLRIRWPKYWSLSFSISPSNEHPGLISFRMDWLDLLAVRGTLKSLLQHHSSKASILRCSAFFMVQLSHPYTTTGNTTALTRRAFAGKGWRAQGYSSVCLQGVSSRGCPCSSLDPGP